MVLRGDYVTPRVNGILFFDKPPLALWLSALSFHLFGVSELAARLPVAVASTALVFLTYLFGARHFGRAAGLLAGAALALNPLFFGTARQMTMDIHQTLWFAVALFSFYAAWARGRVPVSLAELPALTESDRAAPAQRSRITHHASRLSSALYHLFWVACGLGVLAKSVPGLFPLGVAFVFVVVTERFNWRGILRGIWEARVLTGLPLMLAVIVPWFWLAWKANGRVFYEEFWLLHHVQLARGGDFNHAQPVWYYVPALLAGFFPWSLFLPLAAASAASRVGALREAPSGNPQSAIHNPQSAIPTARIFVLVWAAVVLLVFTVMKSKLVSYLLPIYPAAALLVGDWVARTLENREGREFRGLRWSMAMASAIALVALGAGLGVAHFILTSPAAARQRQDVPAAVLEFGVHALIVVAVALTAAAVLVLGRRAKAGVWTMVAGLCTFVALADVEGLDAMEVRMNQPLQSLAAEAGRLAAGGSGLAIHIGQPRRPSVFFYLPPSSFVGKRLPAPGEEGMVLERGETEPVQEFLRTTRPAYVLTDSGRAETLMAVNPSLRIVDRRDRWMLLLAPAHPAVAQRPNGAITRP